MRFLLPGLKRFSLQQQRAIGDELLDSLAGCPALESLLLNPSVGQGGISKDGLTNLLKHC